MLVIHELAHGGVALTIERPDVHNALNGQVIDALIEALDRAGQTDKVRYVVLRGSGSSFCAGADLNWMKEVTRSEAGDSAGDARVLVRLLDRMVGCPKPIIARVHGVALGGGMGLVAACDLVVADHTARFGLTEVRLGLAPAMILPYLMRRVPMQALRRLALLGERIDAEQALGIDLVDYLTDDPDREIEQLARTLCAGGPMALAAVKTLLDRLPQLSFQEGQALTVETIGRLRCSAEGQDGMSAFLSRRKPAWHPDVLAPAADGG
jgi:methylglutaconyl-CoA hydratase